MARRKRIRRRFPPVIEYCKQIIGWDKITAGHAFTQDAVAARHILEVYDNNDYVNELSQIADIEKRTFFVEYRNWLNQQNKEAGYPKYSLRKQIVGVIAYKVLYQKLGGRYE